MPPHIPVSGSIAYSTIAPRAQQYPRPRRFAKNDTPYEHQALSVRQHALATFATTAKSGTAPAFIFFYFYPIYYVRPTSPAPPLS